MSEPRFATLLFPRDAVRIASLKSGVIPANQTEEVRFVNFHFEGVPELTCTSKTGFQNQFQTPSPKVREPHLLRFGLPELLIKESGPKMAISPVSREKHTTYCRR